MTDLNEILGLDEKNLNPGAHQLDMKNFKSYIINDKLIYMA